MGEVYGAEGKEAVKCLICNSSQTDKCHIKSRGSGGKDDNWNLIYMCRFHHTAQHQYGWKKFTEEFPIVGDKLKEMGWEFNEHNKLVRA